MGVHRVYGRILLLVASGLALGVLLGNAAKALMAIDPVIRWFFVGCFVFFGMGAGFLSAFNRAEREHELQMAAWVNKKERSTYGSAPLLMLRRVK